MLSGDAAAEVGLAQAAVSEQLPATAPYFCQLLAAPIFWPEFYGKRVVPEEYPVWGPV